jgi:DNA primase
VLFRPAFLDELRSRVRLSDWIGRAVRLERRGREYVGSCPFHRDRTPSFTVRDDKGFFHCFGCGAHGDVIEFVSRYDNLDFGDAVRRLAAELAAGIPVADHTARPDRIVDQAERRERIAYARRLWARGRDPRGTLVEVYLRSRELPLAGVLRFAPYCRNRETQRSLPTMLAPVVDVNGNFIAVHRTWLRPDGSGKADLREPKMSLAPIGGGVVRLAPPAPMLVIAEGIENALTAIAAGYAAWSALNAGNLAGLPLPLEVEEVVIVADNDANGTGQRAAQRAADRWSAEGRRVRVALLQQPGQDANDLLRGEGGQHVDRWASTR